MVNHTCATLSHLSLFSGIGGLDLAAEAAGFTTVGQCEWAEYPTRVLQKHWPDVPRWKDIRTLTGDDFYDKTGLRTVNIISGGFPCQPFSVAGKQKAKEDDRYLWPEMLRVIREIKPRWVLGENVPGILRLAATDVVSDLEREGYDVVVFDFEAAAVGAPHRRERIAFVASNHETVADCDNWSRLMRWDWEFSEADGITRRRRDYGGGAQEPFAGRWWKSEPGVDRVVYGVPNRVDRNQCLGNAVVPAQFYPIFMAISVIENLLQSYHVGSCVLKEDK